MNLLEIAQRLVGYDAATTPQKELADARRRAKEAEARYQNDEQVLSKLDDTVVYEWRHNGGHGYPRPRTIAKQTAKQVRLAPVYREAQADNAHVGFSSFVQLAGARSSGCLVWFSSLIIPAHSGTPTVPCGTPLDRSCKERGCHLE